MLKYSVVIPTKDREKLLSDCVSSIVAQSLRPIEVIIVDDGRISESKLRELEQLLITANIQPVYIRKSAPGLAESKNIGAHSAVGDIVLFLDDDIVLEPDYLLQIDYSWQRHWVDQMVVGVSGIIINERDDAGISARVFRSMFGLNYVDVDKRWSLLPWGFQTWDWRLPSEQYADWVPGGTSSFRRSLFDCFSFAPLQPGRTALEDIDFGYQVTKAGLRFVMTPAARLHHFETPIARERAYRAGWKEGANRVIIFRRHCRHTVANRLRFVWAAFGAVLKHVVGVFINRKASLMHVGYGFGMTMGYVFESIRHRKK